MDETFLVLLAAILGMVSIGVYASILESQRAMDTTLLSAYLNSQDYRQIADMLLARYATLGSVKVQALQPSGSRFPKISSPGMDLGIFKAKPKDLSRIHVCVLVLSASNDQIFLLQRLMDDVFIRWFSGKNFGAGMTIFRCTDLGATGYLDCYNKFVAKNKPFVQTCDAVLILDNQSLYSALILGPKLIVVNPSKCPLCELAAAVAEITEHIYVDEPCLTSMLLRTEGFSNPESELRGILCSESIERLVAYLVSKSNPMLEYQGPSGNLTKELQRLKKIVDFKSSGYFVPGLSFCVFETPRDYVACDLKGCVNISSKLATLSVSWDPKKLFSILDRSRYLCNAIYGSCKPLWCLEGALWYKVSDGSLIPAKLANFLQRKS
jgi:hypothetical protein